MNERHAQFIIRLTVSRWLPTLIGRRHFWHRLYYRAAEVVRRSRLTPLQADAAGSNQNEDQAVGDS